MVQSKEERAAYKREWRANNKDKIASSKRAWVAENKDKVAKHQSKYHAENKGDIAVYKREHNQTPEGRFVEHRSRAKARGVEFLFTFAEWWAVWEEHWEGRGTGQLVMCRTGDVGPYAVGNVRIDTQANNVKEMQSGKMYRQDST